jgi:glucose uptake protein
LFVGVALVTAAIVLDAMAYRRLPGQKAAGLKGIVLSVLCGVVMSLFYFLVARSMSDVKVADGVLQPLAEGKLTPYTAMVCFSLGILASNFLFNTAIMIKPFQGDPLPLTSYFKGTFGDHLWGIVGGMIWGIGMTFSIIAAGEAGFAISYGLGQGATLIAAIWGVFIWREFREAAPGTNRLLALMFIGYIVGLLLVIVARVA